MSVRTADGVPYESPPGAPVTPAHPLLLDDPGPWRRLLAEHDAVQGIEQVSRRVHRGREGHDPELCDPDPSRSRSVTGVLADAQSVRAKRSGSRSSLFDGDCGVQPAPDRDGSRGSRALWCVRPERRRQYMSRWYAKYCGSMS
ncbi:hypothetical protein ACTMTI_53315 [Nonomuraea sp. H19]|uniref:hypothetical protein n=1 Tax=Nonomuraea sp. H19 TaxID=3452206 RepID=UPI003F8B8E7D